VSIGRHPGYVIGRSRTEETEVSDIQINEKIDRPVYILQSRHATTETWFEEGRSYFEDDMDELFNKKDDINGHDTYHQIIEVTVKRRV
jgi:hypothetical protein